MNDRIKVLLADDHAIVRMGLSALLETKPDIEVVGEAANGDLAVKKALKLKPDIVIMDLQMPRKDGVAATEEIHSNLSTAKVILLTTFASSDGIFHALDNANAILLAHAQHNDPAVGIGERAVRRPEVTGNTTAPPLELDRAVLPGLDQSLKLIRSHRILRTYYNPFTTMSPISWQRW